MAELTEAQKAGLDLLIANKKENALFITDVVNDVANVANAVVAVTAAAAAVAAVTAGVVAEGDTPEISAADKAKFKSGISLDELIEVRRKAG